MTRKLFASGFLSTSLVAGSLLAASSFAASGALAADSFAFDRGHSELTLLWNHAGVSDQTAEFTDFSGTLVLDEENPQNSKVTVKVKVDSLHTGFGPLDTELKGPGFFNEKQHPEITFESTVVRQTGTDTADVDGNLTVLGVTKPTTLSVTLNHLGDHPLGQFIDYYSGKWAGFNATTSINRSDFGMGAFAPLTSDRVDISINVELQKK